MPSVLRTTFIIIIFLTITVSQTFAEADTFTGLSSQVVFIIAIIIGIIVALILGHVANEGRQAKGKIITSEIRPGELDPNEIFQELKDLSGSTKNHKKAATAISDLFEGKIEEKVTIVKKELAEKYGKLVEEKTQAAIESQRKFKKTLSEKKQTEAIVRSVAAGVVVVNNKGEVLLINPAAEKLLNTTKEEKVGKSLKENATEEQLFSMARASSLSGEADIEIDGQENTKKILRSSSAVIEDENGKTVGMVTVLNDITKQKELDTMKDQFLSNVTHELRNPIGAIKQSLSVILEETAGPITEPQKKFLSNANRNLERLGTLIDDILDLAKLEAKKMEVKLQASVITTITNEVCQTLDAWIKSKDISLVNNVPDNLPEINVDPDRIIQVLMNIISNAIKFTPKGGTITLGAQLSEKGDQIKISVTDTGVGIAKNDLTMIFGKFQQAKNRSSADTSGTGLGLAIAQEIVQLHKGEIHVDSEEGKGTTFTFTLPTAEKQ